MKHASLFSGIGGFDIAAEWAGWENILHCEKDAFCRKVLKYYWPKAQTYEDITTTDFTIWRGKIDILSGGFPCQDASKAKQSGGGQLGLKGAKTGLYWELERAICQSKPKYVVLENVSNLLNTNKGKDWRQILQSLSGMGYNAEWRVCRASEVGGSHHRARVFLVAYSNSIGIQKEESFFKNVGEKIQERRRVLDGTNSSVGVSWNNEPSISFVDDGFQKKLDGITLPKWQDETIKAAGNAIVPQVALQIFKSINEYESKKL